MNASNAILAIGEAALASHEVQRFLERVTAGASDPVAKKIREVLPAKSPTVLALEDLLAQTKDPQMVERIHKALTSLGA